MMLYYLCQLRIKESPIEARPRLGWEVSCELDIGQCQIQMADREQRTVVSTFVDPQQKKEVV